MVSKSASLRLHARALPAFVAFALAGCVVLWLALSGLLPVVHAIYVGSPMLRLDPLDAIGLPLAMSFFALAAMTMCTPPTVLRGRARHSVDGAAIFLGIAVLGGLLAALASPLARIIIGWTAVSHGYVACPAIPGERHAPDRWLLERATASQAVCPLHAK